MQCNIQTITKEENTQTKIYDLKILNYILYTIKNNNIEMKTVEEKKTPIIQMDQ